MINTSAQPLVTPASNPVAGNFLARHAGWWLLILWFFLIAFQLFKVFHTPIGFDDSVFGQAAKNLSLGNGYATASFDKLYPFSPGISSGPVVILPAALMIRLLGNGYWVPGLASVLLINGLLVALYFQCGRLMPAAESRRQCALVFLFLSMLLTNHETGFLPEKMLLWHNLMGEVPSGLLVVMAVLRVAEGRYQGSCLFWGGILAGLAGLCKLQSAIGGVTLGIGLLVHYRLLNERPLSWRPARNLALYAIGFLLPLLTFEIIKIIGLGGWNAYLANILTLGHAMRDMDQITKSGDILVKLFQLGEFVGLSHIEASASLAFRLQIFLVVTVFVASVCYFTFYLYRQGRSVAASEPIQWACTILLACCMAHFFWWIFICTARLPRYALQGMLYGIGALSLKLSLLSRDGPRKGGNYMLGALLLAACLRYERRRLLRFRLAHQSGIRRAEGGAG